MALALVATAGCGVNDEPKSPDTSKPRNSAKARCVAGECSVRVICKGKLSVVVGPAPVKIRTRDTALRTSVVADFAGSDYDATVRC